MNLAFPVLCILLLVLPGVLFRKAFARAAVPIRSFKGKRKHAVNKYPVSIRPLNEEVALSLVWAILLNVFWLTAISVVVGWNWLSWTGLFREPIDYRHVIKIIHGTSNIGSQESPKPSDKISTAQIATPPPQAQSNEKNHTYSDALDYLADHRKDVVAYFLSLYAFSFFAGRSSLWVVRGLRLDHRFIFVRLEDPWFYFLRGENFKFSEFKDAMPPGTPPVEISGTYISIVVTQSGKDYLYKGFLWDFELDRDGKLDRVVLHHVIRSEFDPKYSASEKQISTPAIAVPSGLQPPPLVEANPPFQDVVPSVAAEMETPPPKILIEAANWTFQPVNSQLFTVRYSDCITLACTYFYIRQKKQPKQKGPPEEAASSRPLDP